jgi:UDP-N-acetylmuramyl tripeptide synthase
MLDPRLALAVALGKAAGLASRALRLGGGTNLPGVVARRIDPRTLRKLAATLPQGVALVAGTNGKTTTTRMIAATLAADGRPPLHNRAGANLASGITATALIGSSLAARPRARLGLFETDEAAFPRVLAETQPRLVLLHNLFRDQLDRYGEVDTIATQWRAALETLPSTSTVLLNADDPAIAALGVGLAAQVRFYGIEDTRHAAGAAAHVADARFCRVCGAPYIYRALFYAHIGHYHCPRCGHTRPTPHYRLEQLALLGAETSVLRLSYPGGAFELRLPLPGLYNAANALAAVAACLELYVPPKIARDTLERFEAAFGRIERINAAGRSLLLALIKNPVGASETVRMLTSRSALRVDALGDDNVLATNPTPNAQRADVPPPTHPMPNTQRGDVPPTTNTTRNAQREDLLHLLILINDRHADGTDVSWLWDAEFERLAGRVAHATVGGTRAEDMAVRLKYAGVAPERITVQDNLAQALDSSFALLPADETLFALPTYTAMLELRAELVRRGWARPFWED